MGKNKNRCCKNAQCRSCMSFYNYTCSFRKGIYGNNIDKLTPICPTLGKQAIKSKDKSE